MIQVNRRTTKETRRIEELLRTEFPITEVYRYNPAAIRIRIIDDRFAELSRSERHELVEPFLKQLPEESQLDITMLVLITEDERERSPTNLEFEDPSPSRL